MENTEHGKHRLGNAGMKHGSDRQTNKEITGLRYTRDNGIQLGEIRVITKEGII